MNEKKNDSKLQLKNLTILHKSRSWMWKIIWSFFIQSKMKIFNNNKSIETQKNS